LKTKYLNQPLKIGDLTLKNRVIMAPLTRCRADNPARIPNDLMKEYYTQRSGMGLIITEATCISPMGVGYPQTPGIWSHEQVQGWKKITQSVHEAGGKIFLQLWHVGRISDPLYLGGQLPVAPSAIRPKGFVSLVRPAKEFVTPRALETSEIPEIIRQYAQGAENAKGAGFDGVEIHGANGYLLDQFLQDSTNHRTDQYGGSVENRARLMLEVTDACIQIWGSHRVGMHLAPRMDSHDIGDSNPQMTFSYVARELKKRNIAFICSREAQKEDSLGPLLKKEFGGVYIANERFNLRSAEEIIASGNADAVAFGVLAIANPDLPVRFFEGKELNQPNKETFYTTGAQGYTDYPFSKD
jgi:2,4-dienoyl-CoA reductase-like NADH-dependent reductase (Old Yellow Enzyme family)